MMSAARSIARVFDLVVPQFRPGLVPVMPGRLAFANSLLQLISWPPLR